MKFYVVDFETASGSEDLTKVGLSNYVADMARWYSVAIAGDTGPVESYNRATEHQTDGFDALCKDFIQHIADGKPVIAHNAPFDYCFLNDFCAFFERPDVEIKKEQMKCTMFMANSLNLPGSLDRLGDIFYGEGKLGEGQMLLKKYLFISDLDKCDNDEMDTIDDYCRRDVAITRKLLGTLATCKYQFNWDVFYRTWEINDRGIPFDDTLLMRAYDLANHVREEASKGLTELTDGVVTKQTQKVRIKKYFHEVLNIPISGVSKAVKHENRKLCEGNEKANAILDILDLYGGVAVDRIPTLRTRLSPDNRLRNHLIANGAGATSRWASKGFNSQNMPRLVVKDEDNPTPELEKQRAILMDDLSYENQTKALREAGFDPLVACTNMIRYSIRAPEGKKLLIADYSSIEAKLLSHLAGDKEREDIFDKGGDIYKATAAKIYKKPVEEIIKSERGIGKICELALGYAGGKGALASAFAKAGIIMSEEEIEDIVNKFRKGNPKLIEFAKKIWNDFQYANVKYFKGCQNKVTFQYLTKPSGIQIPVINAQQVEVDGKMYWVEQNTKTDRANVNPSTMIGRFVQSTARDIIGAALNRIKGDVIQVIHDEVIMEIDEKTFNMEEFEKQFCTCDFLEMNVKMSGDIVDRYCKT